MNLIFKNLPVKLAGLIVGAMALGWMTGPHDRGGDSAAIPAGETYRLVHAIGNDEHFVAKGLSLDDCRLRKSNYVAVNDAVTGLPGSVTCQPESLYQ